MHQIKRMYKDNRSDQNPLLHKGKYKPVEFRLESRGGNKKVTSITNLAAFEIDPNQLQSKLRKDIGCSVSVTLENENTSASVLTAVSNYVIDVQGNQINSIAEILKSIFLFECFINKT